jgi:hypothetical protein
MEEILQEQQEAGPREASDGMREAGHARGQHSASQRRPIRARPLPLNRVCLQPRAANHKAGRGCTSCPSPH